MKIKQWLCWLLNVGHTYKEVVQCKLVNSEKCRIFLKIKNNSSATLYITLAQEILTGR